MDIKWIIEPQDIKRVKQLIKEQRDNVLVRKRYERNLAKKKPRINEAGLWEAMAAMRLTSQQKSGPESYVARYIKTQPFPLGLDACREARNVERFILKSLASFGGIRFTSKIANELARNLDALEKGEWAMALQQCNRLIRAATRNDEIEVARYLQSKFLGFGPKQARNLLQYLGLTRYEIPIDSRVTKWLNEAGFPVKLSSTALADENYYRFVSDGIQALSDKCGVEPCILDAAIFAAQDSVAWTEENISY